MTYFSCLYCIPEKQRTNVLCISHIYVLCQSDDIEQDNPIKLYIATFNHLKLT